MADVFVQEFVAESWINLSRLDAAIVSLETEPSNTELLADLFRTLHTLKATSDVLRLTELGRVAHAAENVLGNMRDGSLAVNPSAIAVLREGIDRIKELLTCLEATGEEPQRDSDRLIHKFDLPAASAESRTIPAATPAIGKPNALKIAATTNAAATGDAQAVPHPAITVDGGKSAVGRSLRVNVDVLDRLIDLVGELDVTRNQLQQLVRDDAESNYAGPISQLNRVTTDLQTSVMRTRMQPVGEAWSTLPRLVRDLSRITGKPIELELQGAETELDRTLLEAIRDSLMHLIRNAADHGIERPNVRRSVGKSETGRLKLDAVSEAGHVLISLEDDGAGVPRRKVIQTALRQGLITDAEAAELPDPEILRLLFRPGFSTAEQVTTVSGRGVGLDVVRTAIDRIGGTVELTSTPGLGTKISLKIPSTMAVILDLVVEGGEPAPPRDADASQAETDGFPRTALRQTPKTVLVIDDSLFFRQLVRTALEADGYRTTVADSAERARGLIDEGHHFDVILCDIEMPGMDGCQFAAWFRQRHATADTPLVAITSLDGDVHGPRIMAAGFDRLLIKFHPQQLRQTLSDVLSIQADAVRGLCA